MKQFKRNIKSTVASIVLAMALFSCSVIDDNMDNCPSDAYNFRMEYQLRLVTNMTTELSTLLSTSAETPVAEVLRAHLQHIFSDFAHDVDLSFYDTDGDFSRLQHDTHIMDANQSSYELTLPMRKYRHLAVANIVNNDEVRLGNDDRSPSSALIQQEGSSVASHTTGLFTARHNMEVLSGIDQTFNVRLYMANSATALVIDPAGNTYKNIEVRAKGFATQFNISDSTYVYPDNAPYIVPEVLNTGNNELCFCTVNFPSMDQAPSLGRAGGGVWQYEVYVTRMDDMVTKTVIDVNEPLKAGQLRIVKGLLDSEGVVRSSDQKVGISVTLDWNNGEGYNTEL